MSVNFVNVWFKSVAFKMREKKTRSTQSALCFQSISHLVIETKSLLVSKVQKCCSSLSYCFHFIIMDFFSAASEAVVSSDLRRWFRVFFPQAYVIFLNGKKNESSHKTAFVDVY